MTDTLIDALRAIEAQMRSHASDIAVMSDVDNNNAQVAAKSILKWADQIATLLDQAKGQTETQQWKPIETHDGNQEPVLVTYDGIVGEANYHGENDGWWWANNHPTDVWGRRVYPTHWMPLPDGVPAPHEGSQG